MFELSSHQLSCLNSITRKVFEFPWRVLWNHVYNDLYEFSPPKGDGVLSTADVHWAWVESNCTPQEISVLTDDLALDPATCRLVRQGIERTLAPHTDDYGNRQYSILINYRHPLTLNHIVKGSQTQTIIPEGGYSWLDNSLLHDAGPVDPGVQNLNLSINWGANQYLEDVAEKLGISLDP